MTQIFELKGGHRVAVVRFDDSLVLDTRPDLSSDPPGPRVYLQRSRDQQGWVVFVHRDDGQEVVSVDIPDDEAGSVAVEVGHNNGSGGSILVVEPLDPEGEDETE